MNNRINLLEILQRDPSTPLELIRVTESDIALIPFTPNTESLNLHYCEENEIRSYVHCLGAGCLLCQVGRKQETRLLLPMYLPTAKAVGVLSLSQSLRPCALLPQLGSILRAKTPMVAFVRKDGWNKFVVSTKELAPDEDAGEEVIQPFREKDEAGEVDLGAVYPTLENAQLAQVTEIAEMMRLKGVSLDANDSRP